MAIKYCSWATGSDDTGDGSYDNPYKTIQKASTGLGAGDEVRVAKSPNNTDLSGTLAFTKGSTAVVGTDTAFTTELVLGDFIKGGDGNWWEVVVITDDTHVTLYQKYSGDTCSGVSSQKLGLTCTGQAGGQTTVVQSVSASGSSSDFLYISGGWDLSTQTQTGVTNFQQLHTTFTNRNGYGLYLDSRNYVKMERLNFFRYTYGIYLYNNTNNVVTSPTCNSNGFYGINVSNSRSNTFTSPICNSNSDRGFHLYYSTNNTFTSPTCNSNGSRGIYLTSTSTNNTFTSPSCNSNTECGIYIENNNNTFTSPTCNSNGSYGIYDSGENNTFISPTCNSNGYGIYLINFHNVNIFGTVNTSSNTSAGIYSNTGPIYVNKANLTDTTKLSLSFPNYANFRFYINNIGGYSQIWTDGGNIVSQDATAGGSGIEWKFNVTSANRDSNYPLSMEVARVAVQANKQVTVKLYFKKSSTGIAGDLFLRGGQIAGVDDNVKTTCPDNTNRNQVQIQFTPTEKGVVAIEARAWYVSSTTDYLIIDDIDISQAD